MKKLWKGLNVPQRFGLIVLLLITVILSTFFIVKSFEPDLTVLYSDLAEADVMTITENLKKNGYSFKLTDDKKTVPEKTRRLHKRRDKRKSFPLSRWRRRGTA